MIRKSRSVRLLTFSASPPRSSSASPYRRRGNPAVGAPSLRTRVDRSGRRNPGPRTSGAGRRARSRGQSGGAPVPARDDIAGEVRESSHLDVEAAGPVSGVRCRTPRQRLWHLRCEARTRWTRGLLLFGLRASGFGLPRSVAFPGRISNGLFSVTRVALRSSRRQGTPPHVLMRGRGGSDWTAHPEIPSNGVAAVSGARTSRQSEPETPAVGRARPAPPPLKSDTPSPPVDGGHVNARHGSCVHRGVRRPT